MCGVSNNLDPNIKMKLSDVLNVCLLVSFSWISVLSNSKQEALSVALDGGRRGGLGESSLEDLTRAITDDIKRMPGNNNCCDCGAPGNSQSISTFPFVSITQKQSSSDHGIHSLARLFYKRKQQISNCHLKHSFLHLCLKSFSLLTFTGIIFLQILGGSRQTWAS